METAKTYKVIGISKDIQKCDCCGKEDIKKTVVMENMNDGTINYFGTTCATKINGFSYTKLNKVKFVLDSNQLELVIRINRIKRNNFLPQDQKEKVLSVLMNRVNDNHKEYLD